MATAPVETPNLYAKDVPSHWLVSLDDTYYGLNEDEDAFFKAQTGISDDAELKNHILEVQAAAYKIYPYPCIRRFGWTKLKISRLFPYAQFLKLGKEREGAIFLDIGCCFGNDARKAIADGWPAQNVVTSDLHKGFWDLGRKLFRDTPETQPIKFVPGDAFDPAHLEAVPPFTLTAPPTTSAPFLNTLTSLNPLRGHVSAIHASSFFHLFLEAEQLQLAHAIAGLLSPEPGSMIFGQHGGLPEKGFRMDAAPTAHGDMFCHSPESWTELWDGVVFEKGAVKVETTLVQMDREESQNALGLVDGDLYLLTWLVIRL